MSTIRILTRVAVPLGIAASTVAIAAAPAFADSSVTVTGASGGEVTQQSTLSIVGHYDNSRGTSSKAVKLVVTDPSGNDHTLWSGTAGPLSSGTSPAQSLDTSCAPWTSPCTDAVNGVYSFAVFVGTTASPSVKVAFKVPPARVNSFDGHASATVATFSWARNHEPDLVGYDLRNGAGNDITPGGLDDGSVCDAGGCSVSIQFGSAAAGSTQQFSIVALRRSAGSGSVASDPASTTVAFPRPPSARPSSGGSGATSGGHSGGGSTAGGSGQGGSGGSTSSGHTFSKQPAAELRHVLPTFSAGAAPNLPSVITEVKPLKLGTYKPLVYPDKVKRDAVQQEHPGVAASVAHDIANVVDSSALWRSLAGAAVLMLIAAHLRAWVDRVAADEE